MPSTVLVLPTSIASSAIPTLRFTPRHGGTERSCQQAISVPPCLRVEVFWRKGSRVSVEHRHVARDDAMLPALSQTQPQRAIVIDADDRAFHNCPGLLHTNESTNHRREVAPRR